MMMIKLARPIQKKQIKINFIVSLLLIFTCNIYAQGLEVPLAIPGWGKTIKSKSSDKLAISFQGAVHIGPQEDSNEPTVYYPNINALDNALLYVQKGILTENLTYIFATEWEKWPDYVFDKNYSLLSLEELERFIKKNGHLPEVISQEEVKRNGVNDKQMNITFLKKIEELTLYTIEQEKTLRQQKITNKKLREDLDKLTEKLNFLTNIK